MTETVSVGIAAGGLLVSIRRKDAAALDARRYRGAKGPPT
jgi:hypothetical protein